MLIASVSIDNTNTPSLRPGIYLLIVNTDLALVIHWPEIGYYEENASSKLKKNMINLHRYCSVQKNIFLFIKKKKFKNFMKNLINFLHHYYK